MIGLGVGIDYALFIVTRYRQGLAEGLRPRGAPCPGHVHGRPGRPLRRDHRASFPCCGLFLVGQPFIDGLAVGTILAVLVVMLAALTLLPAMLGFSGRAIDRLHVPGLLQSPAPGPSAGSGGGGAAPSSAGPCCAARRPWLVLVILAIPLFSMRLAFTDSGNDPTNLTTRQAYDLPLRRVRPRVQRAAGRGRRVARRRKGPRRGRRRSSTGWPPSPEWPGCRPPAYNAAGDTAVIIVYPTTAPQAAPTASSGQPPPRRGDPSGHRRQRGEGPRRRGDGGRDRRVVYLSHRLPLVIAAGDLACRSCCSWRCSGPSPSR